MTVTTDILQDGLGNTLYRVSRVFPNKASAAKGVEVLGAINAEAFVALDAAQVPCDPPPAIAAMLVELEELGRIVEFDDDMGAPGEPPRCNANGSCE